MTATFNHTIVYATDKRRSAEFLAAVLGLPKPEAMLSFMAMTLDQGVALDFATAHRPTARSTTHPPSSGSTPSSTARTSRLATGRHPEDSRCVDQSIRTGRAEALSSAFQPFDA